MDAAEKVVFNTAILYIRLLIVMILGLLITRIVLDSLGEINYGIYTLVAGVIGVLGVLQSAMSNTSMRFISHSLGSGDKDLLRSTFSTTLKIHLLFGVLIFVFIEIGGLFFFKYFLDIPADKIFDAKILFHFMAITVFISVIAVPYDAVIYAHENILFLSIVDLIGIILHLLLAISLIYLSDFLLIIYGGGILLIETIKRIIKQRYSYRKYPECKYDPHKSKDKVLIRSILSFSGWNFFGSIAAISISQFRSVLLNIFFGVRINASEGIAKTVTNNINTVSANLTQAINPQLVKSEGGGDRERMLRMTSISTKLSVFLYSIFAIPVFIELPYLFILWLKEVPDFAVIFARLSLIAIFIEKFSFQLTNAIRAVGDIRNLTVTESFIIFLNLPVTYFLFKMDFPEHTIYTIGIFITAIIYFERLYFAKNILKIKLIKFVKETLLVSAVPLFLSIILVYLVNVSFDKGLFRAFFSFILFAISYSFLFINFSLTRNEYKKFKSILKKIFIRKNNDKFN